MNRKEFSNRLKSAIRKAGYTIESLAPEIEVSVSGIKKWTGGSADPSLSAIARAANVLHVSVDWLIHGQEPIASAAGTSASADIDEELMGRVVDAIQRLYKEEKIRLPGVELGRLAAEKYKEISASSDDAAERAAMLKLMATQLRNELRAAPSAEATTSKRRA